MRSGQATCITRQAVWLGAFAAAVVAAAAAAAGLRFGHADAWSVWLPSGLVVGAFAVAPRPARSWVVVVFLASMLGTALAAADSPSVAAGVATAGVSQAISFEPLASRGWRRDLQTLNGRPAVLRLFAAAAICAAVGSTAAIAVAALARHPIDRRAVARPAGAPSSG